ncbi:ATP adenylyltransferase [Synechococcus sp. CCY9201]|uniref:ATP adenylyltransferase n=2 Tax=Synechococcus TaxID=1129 RepID=UPI002AD42B0F|nr:ATP adenylyltransferase [Synechococcus sp. CBW1107]MEA5475054.1 ATP adenylyltransferase [Synechococcus sp. CCY9201]
MPGNSLMRGTRPGQRAARLWRRALAVSERALAAGALVPLRTERVPHPSSAPFVLRRLLSSTPKHLRAGGPKPNPFLPWEPLLQVELLGESHVVLLNKFPVQRGHLLLITSQWQAQAGWLQENDWASVAHVASDTGGLWFFNSCAEAGASQPHRHLQLLPRHPGEPSCPLAPRLRCQLDGLAPAWPWAYRLSRRHDPLGCSDLPSLYQEHCRSLGLGSPESDRQPRHPYNLLFDDDWFLTVRRVREHAAGFSVNALGFAGCLLCCPSSRLDWIETEGPFRLLQEVAASPELLLESQIEGLTAPD